MGEKLLLVQQNPALSQIFANFVKEIIYLVENGDEKSSWPT